MTGRTRDMLVNCAITFAVGIIVGGLGGLILALIIHLEQP